MQWNARVEELFHSARSLAADIDREAWIWEHCGNNSELAAEVSSLLRAHDAAIQPASGRTREPFCAAVPADSFGSYRATRLIGRGGMSLVYQGVREGAPFEQNVALKLISPQFSDPEWAYRFETEWRVLAQLEHPNITRLFDGGFSSTGRPYLAMELIEGENFHAFADNRKLSIAERLHLFLQVCDAMDYAHRNLVVHRDLKPANIMVRREGTVKLLDFGTSTLLNPDGNPPITRPGMLTPRYASPEQLRGERLGTSTDIYSLGVILYESLTGAWPFGASQSFIGDLYRATGNTDPKFPHLVVTQEAAGLRGTEARQLMQVLRNDLGAIVLKALEHDRARRYESVRALADDVKAYLARRPVSARTKTFSYRAAKFLDRNRARVALSAAGVALALASSAYIFEQRSHEESIRSELRALDEFYLNEVYLEVAKLPGAMSAELLILDRAKKSLDHLYSQAPHDRATRRALAKSYAQVAEIEGEPFVGNLGRGESAIEDFKRAMLLTADPATGDLESKAVHLRSQFGLAGLEIRAGDYDSAAAQLRQALPVAKELAEAAPQLLVNGKSAASLYVRAYTLLGHALLRAADIQRDLPKIAQARQMFEAAIAEAHRMEARAPGVKDAAGSAWQFVGYCWELAGDFSGNQENYSRALVAHNTALDSVRRELEKSPTMQNERNYSDVLTDVGWCQNLCGRKESVETLTEAAARMRKIGDADPRNEEARLDMATTYERLGRAEVGNRQVARGLEHLEWAKRMIRLPERLTPQDRERVVLFVRIQEGLAEGLAKTGETRQAFRELGSALTIVTSGKYVPDWRIAQLRAEKEAMAGAGAHDKLQASMPK